MPAIISLYPTSTFSLFPFFFLFLFLISLCSVFYFISYLHLQTWGRFVNGGMGGFVHAFFLLFHCRFPSFWVGAVLGGLWVDDSNESTFSPVDEIATNATTT